MSFSRVKNDKNTEKISVAKIKADFGTAHILINNAGITRDGLIMKMSEEAFDAVLDTNLKGTFHTIRHASRYFDPDHGHHPEEYDRPFGFRYFC
mgnify:CR=1 FL=1